MEAIYGGHILVIGKIFGNNKMKNIHKSKIIPIKSASVDVSILPLVEWLNNYESVMTVGSCGGDDKESSYVGFICSEQFVLSSILKEIYEFDIYISSAFNLKVKPIDKFVKVEIEYMPTMLNPIIYQIIFANRKILDTFMMWQT